VTNSAAAAPVVVVVSSAPTGPVEKRGFLMKRGAVMNKDYQKRYFVLQQGVLSYYEKTTDKIPKGKIEIKGLRVHVDIPNEFKIYKPGRIYFLRCHSVPERVEWMNALIQHGAIEKLDHFNCA